MLRSAFDPRFLKRFPVRTIASYETRPREAAPGGRNPDVDKDVLRWTMDFRGDGINEVDGTTGGACRRDFTYAAGTYRPRICVTDLGPDREPLHPFQCKTYTVIAS